MSKVVGLNFFVTVTRPDLLIRRDFVINKCLAVDPLKSIKRLRMLFTQYCNCYKVYKYTYTRNKFTRGEL